MSWELQHSLSNAFLKDKENEVTKAEHMKTLVKLMNHLHRNNIKLLDMTEQDIYITNLMFGLLDALDKESDESKDVYVFNVRYPSKYLNYVFEYQLIKSIYTVDKTIINCDTRYTSEVELDIKECELLQAVIKRYLKTNCEELFFDEEAKTIIEDYKIGSLNSIMFCIRSVDESLFTKFRQIYLSKEIPYIYCRMKHRLDKDICNVTLFKLILFSYLQYPGKFDINEHYYNYLSMWSYCISYANGIVDKYNKALQCRNNPSTKAIRNIKNRIKNLRKTIHSVQQELDECCMDVDVNDESTEELTEVITKNEQCDKEEDCEVWKKALAQHNILVLSKTDLNGNALDGLVDILYLKNFKTLNISSKYEYVVKVTNKLKHHVGYLIDSEAKRAGAKIITVTRTNTKLLLKDIYLQL